MGIPSPWDISRTQIPYKRWQTVERDFLVVLLTAGLAGDRIKSIRPSGAVHRTKPTVANTRILYQLVVNPKSIPVVVIHYQIDFRVLGVSAGVVTDESSVVVT